MNHKQPLRKVIGSIEIEVGNDGEFEYTVNHELLECFHHQMPKQDMYGATNAARRRCWQCQKEMKAFQAVTITTTASDKE